MRPDDDDLSDEAILAAAGRGEGRVFGVFYDRYERAVLAYFRRRTGDAELAADLAAETFAAALVASPRFDGRRGGPPASAWLYGIARNIHLRSLRDRRIEDRARRRLGMEPIVLDDDLLDRIDRLGADDRVRDLLQGLAPDQSEAIRARVVDEQSYAEIAERLACSESVVRKRVSRGLAQLRRVAAEKGRSAR